MLGEGQTLSEFVEASVRAGVKRRRVQAEFIARGLSSRDQARRTSHYVDADVAVAGLQRKLDAARTRDDRAPQVRSRARLTAEAEADLDRLFDFIVERELLRDAGDLAHAERALAAIRASFATLKASPFTCQRPRKANSRLS